VIITASFLKRFWKDQSGMTTIQALVIVAIIGVGLAGAAILVKGSITQALQGF
jgi:Flp pilus assembly pilin Flp